MSNDNEQVNDKNDLVLVGIGASAGGLEALQSLVSNLPLPAECNGSSNSRTSPLNYL